MNDIRAITEKANIVLDTNLRNGHPKERIERYRSYFTTYETLCGEQRFTEAENTINIIYDKLGIVCPFGVEKFKYFANNIEKYLAISPVLPGSYLWKGLEEGTLTATEIENSKMIISDREFINLRFGGLIPAFKSRSELEELVKDPSKLTWAIKDDVIYYWNGSQFIQKSEDDLMYEFEIIYSSKFISEEYHSPNLLSNFPISDRLKKMIVKLNTRGLKMVKKIDRQNCQTDEAYDLMRLENCMKMYYNYMPPALKAAESPMPIGTPSVYTPKNDGYRPLFKN